MTNVFSFTTKIYKLLLKGVTPHPHTRQPGTLRLSPASRGSRRAAPRMFGPLLPPTWPSQAPPRLKHGGVQGLKPHVREFGHLGICTVRQFPFLNLGCIPSTLPQALAGCCVSATMKTKPVSHKTENTYRVSEGAWTRSRESLVSQTWDWL